MPLIVSRIESIQYDGSNGSYICGTWANVTLVSDNGTTLVYADGESEEHPVTNGSWFVRTNPFPSFPTTMTNSQYEQAWADLPVVPEVEITIGTGYALTPTIVASGSANVAVDLDTTMSGTGYQASAVLSGSATLLGALSITGVSITDSNTVTVTVQNNGLVSLAGATVIVSAAELTT